MLVLLQTILAHLSRILRDEQIVYQWFWRLCICLSVIHPLTFSNIFSPETSWPVKLNFIRKLLRIGERKFIQMVLVTWPRWPPTMPIYSINHLKIFSGTRRPAPLGLGMYYWWCEAYQFSSNDGPWLTLIYLTPRSNLLPNAFKQDFF